MKKLKEFFSKNKKKCVTAGVVIIAGVAYCIGADIDMDSIINTICKFVGC